MFLHRYALAIGWPVPLLKKIMSSRDIAEAMAFDRLHPFGDYREDVRSAIVASTIANCHRSSKTKPFSVSDFMPKFSDKKDKKTLNDKIREVFGIGPDSSSPSN